MHLVATAFLLGAISAAEVTRSSGDAETSVCTSRSCVVAATRLLESMDVSVDPCDDFHQFSCGAWIDNTDIPDDKSSYGTIEMMHDSLMRTMKRTLEAEAYKSSSAELDLVGKLKNVYQACMNETEIERLGLQPAAKFLNGNGIQWPATAITTSSDGSTVTSAPFNESAYDVTGALSTFTEQLSTAAHSLVLVLVWVDQKHPERYVVLLDQASLALRSRDYYLRGKNDSVVEAYLKFMTSAGKAFLADKLQQAGLLSNSSITNIGSSINELEAQLESEMVQVLEFETQLATITTPIERRRDPNRMYNNMTIAELTEKTPGFDWLRFLQPIFAAIDIRIDNTEIVIAQEVEYFIKLAALLQKTPGRTVANYLAWRATFHVAECLNKDLNTLRMQLMLATEGVAKQPQRWKTCVKVATTQLEMVAGRLYVEKYFDKRSKQLAVEMMSEIKQTFERNLPEHDWMEPEEKQYSKQKSNLMVMQVAYPEALLNDTWLANRYQEYIGHGDKHFENYVQNSHADERYLRRKLRQTVDRNEFYASPATINAYYAPTSNTIAMLAAILQPPFFDADQPMSLNFGAIGSVMGHELTHGFDDQGRYYNAVGMLEGWWGNKTVAQYDDKKQCLIDQFSSFKMDDSALAGVNVNGVATQGENIADLGGLRQSYAAHQSWLKNHLSSSMATDARHSLPGLQNFTDEQLFFLGNAIPYCSKSRSEALKLQILTDSHSPNKFRINGPVSNLQEFAQAFNCPLGSRMNPEKKCRVW